MQDPQDWESKLIAQMKSEQPAPGQPANGQQQNGSPQPAQSQPQPAQQPAVKLQQSVSYGVQQDPVAYAKRLQLQKALGIPPEVSAGQEQELQQSADANSMNYSQFAAANPRTTAWASNPDNAAVSGVDEVHRLGTIEQHAAVMRAYTPTLGDKISDKFLDLGTWMMGGTISRNQLRQNFWENPAVRYPMDAASGVAGIVGNVGSFLGWHGDGPTKKNLLQRIEASLDPTTANAYVDGHPDTGTPLDSAAKFVGPGLVGFGAGAALKIAGMAVGMSSSAATVLSGLGVGGLFTADQGGSTYTSVAGAGGSDYDARLKANRVAAINALPNALFGATDLPFLKRFPFLTSVGIGAATGASGQFAQNEVTDQPWNQDLLAATVKGAAIQGGLHLGLDAIAGGSAAGQPGPSTAAVPEQFASEFKSSPFLSRLAGAVSEAEESKLRYVSPEKFHEANQNTFAGDASLRIPSDQFSAYFKSKGVDPAEMAKGLGSTNYPESVLSGGDVELAPADFVSKLDAAHARALLPDVVDPSSGLSARQHQEGRAELEQWLKGGGAAETAAGMAAADAETAATPEYQHVKEQLRQRYTDAGEMPEVAETLATKDANAYSNLARNVGMKPSELLHLYNPKVVTGDAPGRTEADLERQSVLHQGGDFGTKHEQFYHDANGAVDQLLKDKSGDAISALHHPDVGDIDLVYGNEGTAERGHQDGFGLAKIAKKHPEVLGDLQGALDGMKVTSRTDNRIQLADGEGKAAVRLTWEGKAKKWLLTAFRGEKGGVSAADGGTTDVTNRAEPAPNPAGQEADRASVHPAKPLHEMSPEELDVAHSDAKARDVNDLKELFGDEGAKRYANLRRASEGMDHARADAASLEVEKMEEGLSPAQRDKLFGVGDDRPQLEEIREYRKALGQVDGGSPDELAESLKYAVAKVDDPGRDTSEMTPEQQLAYAQLRHGFEIATEHGWDTGDIIRKAIKSSAKRFADPEDAMLMLEKVARSVSDGSSAAKVLGEGGLLHQSSEDGTRGWFRVLPDGSYEIGKTKIGDLSTFVHEPAHAYLHILSDLAGRADASEVLKGDYAKVLDFLGAKDGDPFTREQQETWARANEQYLREGKAPSPGLKGTFQRFAIWLGTVYKHASDLGVHLSDNIRGVFDRLYAAETGVDKAESEAGPKLFTSAEEAGWTEEEFRNYADSKGMGVEQAKSEILGKLNEAAVREKTERWRSEEANVRTAVTAQVDQSPEYTAIRSLRRGKLDDGTPLTMDREALVRQFGEDRVKELQKQHPGLYRNEGGIEPESAAEILGFSSADHMMTTLEDTQRRGEVIDQGTRYYMTEKHGDIRYDGTLDDQARLALENDKKSDSLYKELQTLKKQVADMKATASGRKDAMRSIELAPIATYRAAAHDMIESKPVVDLQPTRYLDASRKYSREAFDALRRGDASAAAEAKHKELMNHFLFREATNAKEYIGRFESYAKRMQNKGVQASIGKAGSDYLGQFNKLLFRYGIGNPPAEAPERSLLEWADAQYGDGKEAAIDPSIYNEARSIPYRQASVAEVRILHDALINIRHLAAQDLGMEVNGRKVEFSAAMERMNAQARESMKSSPRPVLDENRTTGQKTVDLVSRGPALLKRMEFMMKQLDGGIRGPWHDNLWHLSADAQGREDVLNVDVTKRIGDALQNMPKEQRMKLLDKVTIDGMTEPVTRRTMLAIAFNMGNEGNIDRLEKTFISHGWEPRALEQIKGELTREEWKFVQDGWDSLKPLGQAQSELEKRLTGLPPVMVKPTPLRVDLADGSMMELDGGYYPVVMDPRFSQRGAQQDASMTAQNLMETGYGRAATSRGNMKERTGFGGPLLLDYEQVLTQHTAKVIKDISHREFMLTANKILMDPTIRQTLRDTVGVKNEAQMMPWLRTIINNSNGSSVQGLSDVSRGLSTLRTNVVKAALGFKVSTLLLQLTHASSVFLHTSPMSYAQAMVDFMAHPKDVTEQIKGLSPNEMASRGDNLDRDMRKVLREGVGRKSVGDVWAKAGMWPVQMMDHVLSFPLWLSVYREALAANEDIAENVRPSESEAKYQAMQKADGAVRMGLGSNAPKDLAPIMRNHDVTKLLTTMGGFHNLKWNQMADVVSDFRRQGPDRPSLGKRAGNLTYGMVMAAIIPAIAGPLLTGRGPKDGENFGTWARNRALLFPLETMAILNIAVEGMENHGDVRYSPIASMLERTVKDGAHAWSDSEDKDWTGMGLNTLQTAMEALGISGTDQAFKIGRYARKAGQGKIEDPNAWGAVAGGSGK